ncbi:MAG TPA: phasin family protein [Stellaceae bacterium]|jgi:hypothetical protein
MPADKPKYASADSATPFGTIFTFNRNALEAWAHKMSKLSREMAQFMQSRLKEEAAMWERLATCQDASELLQCQSEFLAKTGTDYAEAAQKLSRLMVDFANASLKPHRAPETD